MKTIELSDATHAALHRLAEDRNLAVDQLVAALVSEARAFLNGDRLLLFLGGPQFRALADPADRYLALLAWCARNHAADFADFVSRQESGPRFLMLTPEEVAEVRAHNHARQIDGTQFWAVMTLDSRARKRFVQRLLEFIGCHDETVTVACRVLASTADPEQAHLRGVA